MLINKKKSRFIKFCFHLNESWGNRGKISSIINIMSVYFRAETTSVHVPEFVKEKKRGGILCVCVG